MFCLHTFPSHNLNLSLKVKVTGSNPGYLLKSFLLYLKYELYFLQKNLHGIVRARSESRVGVAFSTGKKNYDEETTVDRASCYQLAVRSGSVSSYATFIRFSDPNLNKVSKD